MKVRLSHHGVQRLFERVYKKAQNKSHDKALSFIQKALEKGSVAVNDANQTLVLYANNLYIFRKELFKEIEQLVFVTVKTNQEYRLKLYNRGCERTIHHRKDFRLCA